MRKTIQQMHFRRRREAKTDYKKRFAAVKSGMDRVVVRKTNKRVIGHIVRYTEKGDLTLAYADSKELAKLGWSPRSNRPTAYLVGMLLAKKAVAKPELKGGEMILDIGISSPVKNSIPFAFARGCIDAGLRIRSGVEMDAKVYNYSDVKYIKELKEKDPEKYKRQYGGYIREGRDPEALGVLFSKVREMILNGK